MRADDIASTHTGTATYSEYQQIKETLHQQIIRKLTKSANLADMQLISEYNK